MKVWEKGSDFLTELLADAEVMKALSAEILLAQFDLAYHTKHVDTIFQRVFGKVPGKKKVGR
jgi:adenylosuccinate lyase